MRLKKTLLHFLLLFSLFFNIAHATVIAIEDDCHYESAYEYMAEQSVSTECGDLCDMHHLFHFMAIVNDASYAVQPLSTEEYFRQRAVFYTPPFQKTSIKPPIA